MMPHVLWRRARVASAIGALLVATVGAAQEPAAVPPPPTPDAGPASNRLGVKGRVVVQAERDEKVGREPEESVGLDAARLEVRYERGRWLDAVLEVDVAEGVVLKDAFARLGTRRAAARVGQFKPPISAVELESSWTLPVLRRGVLSQVLGEHMRFTGRRPGVQVEASGGGSLRPGVAVGAFQGLAPGGSLLSTVGPLQTSVAGRASVRPRPLELGAFAALVGTEPMDGFGVGRYWTAGADAVLDVEAAGFGFRAWADAYYGSSFYARGLVGLDGRFAAARGIAAIRWGGLDPGRPYVEAFGLAETVRFDLDAADSTLSNAVAGVNVGLWKRLRLGVQVEERRSGAASAPLTDGGNPLRDRRAFLIELGGSFGLALPLEGA